MSVPKGLLKPRVLFRKALDGIRNLHNTQDSEEAYATFGETLHQMGVRRFLVYQPGPRRGTQRRSLEPSPRHSSGSDWLKAIRANPTVAEAVALRLRDVIASGEARIHEPGAEPDLFEGATRKFYEKLDLRVVYDLPIRTASSRLGVVEVDMSERGAKPSVRDAMVSLCDHLGDRIGAIPDGLRHRRVATRAHRLGTLYRL